MKLSDLIERSAGLDLAAFRAEFPHAALVFLQGGPASVAARGRLPDETGEFKTTTKVRLRSPEPSKLDPSCPVVFLVKRNTWTPFDDVITVGRATVHDVCLPFNTVSKFHACLTRWPQGWKITDERAMNGTYVEGKLIAPGSAVFLREGTVIGFGPEAVASFFTSEGLFHFLDQARGARGS